MAKTKKKVWLKWSNSYTRHKVRAVDEKEVRNMRSSGYAGTIGTKSEVISDLNRTIEFNDNKIRRTRNTLDQTIVRMDSERKDLKAQIKIAKRDKRINEAAKKNVRGLKLI